MFCWQFFAVSKVIKISHDRKNCRGGGGGGGGGHSVITVTGVRHYGLYLEWKQHFIFDVLELTRNIILMAPEQKIRELRPRTNRNFKTGLEQTKTSKNWI